MDESQEQNQTALRRPVRAIPQQQEQKKERIKVWMAACMIIVALCVDLAQTVLTFLGIGLVLGPIMSVVAYFVFWVWFMLLGVSFTKNPKKLAAVGVTAIIEIFLSFLPALTAGVAATIFMTMAEDKGGLLGKATGVASGKVGAGSASRFSKIPQVTQKIRSGDSTMPGQGHNSEYPNRRESEKNQDNKESLKNDDKKIDVTTQAQKFYGQSLKENDLVVPDSDIRRAGSILEENTIPYKTDKYTERKNVSEGSYIPGEFILTIFDQQNPNKPASFGLVKRVVVLLRSSGVVVRYGRNPERG